MKIIRYVLTAILLIVVWNHAHWSVALCLTLAAIATELEVKAYSTLKKQVLSITNKEHEGSI
jgi:hypothetical protein